MPISSKRPAAWGSSDALSNVYHTSSGVPVMMNLSIYYVLLRYMATWLMVQWGSSSRGTPIAKWLVFCGPCGQLRVWWANSGG